MEEDDGGTGMEVEDCDEDIYGDLEGDIFGRPPRTPKQNNSFQEEQYKNVVNENLTLKAKLKKLERENKAYSTNISALYLTAKNEIDKKNFIIKTLQDRLKRVTQSKSNLSKKDAEDIVRSCQEALLESQAQITLDEIKKSLKNTCSEAPRRKKHFRFGNMSLYFFREQGCFERGESVVFPPKAVSKASTEVEGSPEKETEGKSQRKNSLEEAAEMAVYDNNSQSSSDKEPPVVILDEQAKRTRCNNKLSSTGDSYQIPRGTINKNKKDTSLTYKSSSSERTYEPNNNKRRSFERDLDSSREKPPLQRKTRNFNRSRDRDFSPPADRHHRYNGERSNSRNKDTDTYKKSECDRDNKRSSHNHATRSSKRFGDESRHSNYRKRHRSRSRSK